MATIFFSNEAPEVDTAVHFSFSNQDFNLEPNGTFDTDNNVLIEGAHNHPWLDVKDEEIKAATVPERDMNDPHQNPTIDHLGSESSEEVRKLAEERNKLIVNEGATLEEAQKAIPDLKSEQHYDEEFEKATTDTEPTNTEVTS